MQLCLSSSGDSHKVVSQREIKLVLLCKPLLSYRMRPFPNIVDIILLRSKVFDAKSGAEFVLNIVFNLMIRSFSSMIIAMGTSVRKFLVARTKCSLFILKS